MKHIEIIASAVLVLVAISIAGYFAYVATERSLTALESVLFQFLSLGAGLLGSFIFGRQSAKAAAKEMVKPYARSAFRRLMSLYRSLSRVANTIELSRGANSAEPVEVTIVKLEAIVIEQISTADDALEDWRDLVPEDIEELEGQIKERATRSYESE